MGVLTLGLATAGCGDDDDDDTAAAGDTDSDTDTDSDADTDSDSDSDSDGDVPTHAITGTITVPDDYAATASLIGAGLIPEADYPPPADYDQPCTTGLEFGPTIGPDDDYAFEGDNCGLAGNFYVAIILFVDGGGAADLTPVEGVDYAGSSEEAITMGESETAVDIGTIALELYESSVDAGL